MTANTHTIGLLGAELGSESDLLEQEKSELEALENSLADLERLEETQRERLHPFVQHDGFNHPQTITADYETRPSTKIRSTTLANLASDPEAKDVLDKLRHHLHIMQHNVEGNRDVTEALAKSQAALGVLNWRELRTAEYRQVYGLDSA